MSKLLMKILTLVLYVCDQEMTIHICLWAILRMHMYYITSSCYTYIWQVHAFPWKDAEALASTLEAANIVLEAARVQIS